MDPVGIDSVNPSGTVLENLVSVIGDKRLADCNEGDNLTAKKARVDSSGGDMKRVAEIVLVLSAMEKMRGGRNATVFEKRLMVEAREKLTSICRLMSPRDVIPSDAARVVIEDLGLNNSIDHRLGFRPPKMSISEKVVLSKRKMEDSKKFAAQSGTYSSQILQTGYKADNSRTSLHTAHKSPAEKPTPAISVGGFQTASPVVHVPSLALMPSLKQLPVNEVQSTSVSRGLVGNASGIDSSSLHLPRTEGAPFRSDGKLNGSIYSSRVQANSSGCHLPEKAAIFSPQSLPVAKVGQANKALDHTLKVDETSELSTFKEALQVTRDQNSKPSVIQTTHGNSSVHQPSQSINYQRSSSVFSNHNDIAKNVQKLLCSRPSQRPNWTPPSTYYMNKSLTCQICKVTISDVESLLVCDACEKGVHLKCRHSYNQKGIPKGEWHCPKCLISSNGKPLPPKYGRVTRNVTTQKLPSNTTKIQPSCDKVESQDQKVYTQKITANGNSDAQNLAPVGSTGSNNSGLASDLHASNAIEGLGANVSSSNKEIDEKPPSEMRSLPRETTGVCGVPYSIKPSDSSIQSSPCQPEGSFSEVKSLLKIQSGNSRPDKPSNASSDKSKLLATCISEDVDKADLPSSTEISVSQNHEVKSADLRETFEHSSDVRQDDQDVAQTILVGTSDVVHGAGNCTVSSLNGTHNVDWVGDILNVVDEKAFYSSCHINGIVYKLQDHALFRSNNESLRPSKLQSLWEDIKTGSKWAVVNRCYLPDDLPEVVGRPCTPETNEVYESNHGSTVRAVLIQGPCNVLSPNKFMEERERRSHLEHETIEGLQPVFLCKWFYDESKGLFRAVTD